MKIIQTPCGNHVGLVGEVVLTFPSIPRSHLRKNTAPAIRSVQHLGCAGSAEDSLSYGALLAQETNNKSVVKL